MVWKQIYEKNGTDLHFYFVLTECQNALGKTPLLQGVFYVFHKGNVCSSVRNHMFLLLKTYGSGSGDVKNKTGISRKTGLRFPNSFPNFEMPFLFRIFKNQIYLTIRYV